MKAREKNKGREDLIARRMRKRVRSREERAGCGPKETTWRHGRALESGLKRVLGSWETSEAIMKPGRVP